MYFFFLFFFFCLFFFFSPFFLAFIFLKQLFHSRLVLSWIRIHFTIHYSDASTTWRSSGGVTRFIPYAHSLEHFLRTQVFLSFNQVNESCVIHKSPSMAKRQFPLRRLPHWNLMTCSEF